MQFLRTLGYGVIVLSAMKRRHFQITIRHMIFLYLFISILPRMRDQHFHKI